MESESKIPSVSRRKSSTAYVSEKMRRLLLSSTKSPNSNLLSIPEQNDKRKRSVQVKEKAELTIWQPNPYTRNLIRRTWDDEFDTLYQIGSDIYEKIFESIPEAFQLFPAVAKYGDKWKESSAFRTQVLRFVQVIAAAVTNLRDLNDFHAKTLYKVGRAHCKYADRGFRYQHWAVFQTAIKKTMKARVEQMPELSDQEKEDALEAWDFLAQQIVQGMSKGFLDGMDAGKRKLSF